MRQKTILSVTVSVMLISQCCACASQKDAAMDFHAALRSARPTETPMHLTIQEIQEMQDRQNMANIPEIQSIQGIHNVQATNGTPMITYTALTSPVALVFYTEEQSTAIRDHTIYTNRCVYPIVTIEGNESAAAKINADIQKRVDAYQASANTFSFAEDDYQHYVEEDFLPSYYDELIFTAARADNRVISFLVMDQSYGGGAHGMDYYTGLNYDTKTGERISFSELSDNADRFRQDTLTYHQNLAATASFQSIMYNDATDDLEQVLYQDGRWYFSMSGLVFFSNPYELGAFYAGEIEFTIPYDDLAEMSLNEEYAYEGIPLIHLQSEEPYFYDINGDGIEEEIQFYIDNMGSSGTDLHFFINGTDFATTHKELAEQFSDNYYISCWAKCFLYDIDESDDLIEILFQMNYSDWEEDILAPHTFFYRYEKSGALTYLGKLETTANAPTTLFHFVP